MLKCGETDSKIGIFAGVLRGAAPSLHLYALESGLLCTSGSIKVARGGQPVHRCGRQIFCKLWLIECFAPPRFLRAGSRWCRRELAVWRWRWQRRCLIVLRLRRWTVRSCRSVRTTETLSLHCVPRHRRGSGSRSVRFGFPHDQPCRLVLALCLRYRYFFSNKHNRTECHSRFIQCCAAPRSSWRDWCVTGGTDRCRLRRNGGHWCACELRNFLPAGVA